MKYAFKLLCVIIILSLQAYAKTDEDSTISGNSVVEKNAKPGINKGFKDPDLSPDRYAQTFARESREVFALRHQISAEIGLKKGDRVADIGAGSGIYVNLIAEAVGAKGTVYAVDIAQPFLDFIQKSAVSDGLTNVKTVLGEDKTSNLPDSSVDIVFHSNTYHHFEYPLTMTRDLSRALVNDGEMYVLDFESVSSGHVRAGKEVVISEIESSGFVFVEEIDIPSLQENYLLRFRKGT